jgi:hypothetical protein
MGRVPGPCELETFDTDQRNDLYAIMLHDEGNKIRKGPGDVGRLLGLDADRRVAGVAGLGFLRR